MHILSSLDAHTDDILILTTPSAEQKYPRKMQYQAADHRGQAQRTLPGLCNGAMKCPM